MSQIGQTEDQTNEQERQDAQFEEGFALADDGITEVLADLDVESTIQDAANSVWPELSEELTPAKQQAMPAESPAVPPFPPASQPVEAQQAPVSTESPQSPPQAVAPVSTVTISVHIADEFASLQKLNPDAALLAQEDSPEGASIRARLEQYGAELAQDRAERVLWQRQKGREEQRVQAAHWEREKEAHNAHFFSTLQREHPTYTAMLLDPARQTEAVQYQQDIYQWIAAKPYGEAAQLMDIAKSGRDPAHVSALLTQFERERGKKSRMPDPTGALAVPGRGAPVAPSGIGDKDDFDAGWNANLSK